MTSSYWLLRTWRRMDRGHQQPWYIHVLPATFWFQHEKVFYFRSLTWQSVRMMTSSNGNSVRVTGLLCGEFTGHKWIPLTEASDAEVWWFNLRLNKRLNTQSWGWWFETSSHPLWHHCDGKFVFPYKEISHPFHKSLIRWVVAIFWWPPAVESLVKQFEE